MIEIPAHLLPPKLREIADYCGIETARLLLEQAGGRYLYVPYPEHLHALHPLVEWLGGERATQFCHKYAGENIQMPRAAAALRAIRDQVIREERRAGATLANLATRYGLTQRSITTIVGQDPADDQQFDLFGIEP